MLIILNMYNLFNVRMIMVRKTLLYFNSFLKAYFKTFIYFMKFLSTAYFSTQSFAWRKVKIVFI